MSPEGQVFGAMFLGVMAGFLACIVVELAYGRGTRLKRGAIGLAIAILDLLLYVAFLNITINVGVAAGPSAPSSGPGPVILVTLAAWIVPAARLWWLRRGGPPRG